MADGRVPKRRLPQIPGHYRDQSLTTVTSMWSSPERPRNRAPVPSPAIVYPCDVFPINDALNEPGVAVQPNNSYIPKLPIFSGDAKDKSSVSFKQWWNELALLEATHSYTSTVLCLAARRSLRGAAANVVLHLGADTTLISLRERVKLYFGSVQNVESLLESFYTAKQSADESVSTWGSRLENLWLSIAAKNERLAGDRNQLATKFFTGLQNWDVKTMLRHHHEGGMTFEQLLTQARLAEQERSLSSTVTTSVSTSATETDRLDSILNKLDQLCLSKPASTTTQVNVSRQLSHVRTSATQPAPTYSAPYRHPYVRQMQSTSQPTPRMSSGYYSGSSYGQVCGHCSQPGHTVHYCPVRLQLSGLNSVTPLMSVPPPSAHVQAAGASYNPRCYQCNQLGHIRSQCPLNQASAFPQGRE